MTRRLTDGQKKARAVVRAAAKKLIQELDAYSGRRESVLFEAHFHLECWRFDKGYAFGFPIKSGLPIYAYSWAGRREPTHAEIEAARQRSQNALA